MRTLSESGNKIRIMFRRLSKIHAGEKGAFGVPVNLWKMPEGFADELLCFRHEMEPGD